MAEKKTAKKTEKVVVKDRSVVDPLTAGKHLQANGKGGYETLKDNGSGASKKASK